ncbi:DinB family protein [Psychrobacillus sp. FSL W7-1457]|uniref:DinB family protein n=1 Tax=Psychrobacillus sp. FSL W7-1457 TaxID=2954547 RepID=UPI00315A49BB
MLFPYRNDYRKTLLPYLKNLPEENWLKTTKDYPNNLAWVISHIATSEDYWINEVAFKKNLILTVDEYSQPLEIIKAYEEIRLHTDAILESMETIDLNQLIEVPIFSDGWSPPSIPTIRWAFQHVYGHETYHIGQIAVIAHLNGFQKPLF